MHPFVDDDAPVIAFLPAPHVYIPAHEDSPADAEKNPTAQGVQDD